MVDQKLSSSNTKKIAYLLVVLATIIWGSTYILTKQGIQVVPPFIFQGVRVLIAFLCFFPFFPRLRKLNWKIMKAGMITGSFMFLLMLTATFGLETSTASNAAFISALYVPFTPVFAWLILRDKISKMNWLSVGIALFGMALLVFLPSGFANIFAGINWGDILLLLGSIFSAIQIVTTEKFVKEMDIILFIMAQLIVIITLCFISSLLFQEWNTPFNVPSNYWQLWLYMGIIALAITALIQNWAQKHIEATPAALLYVLEPVFGTLFGILLGNEAITWAFLIGAGFILLGILLSILPKHQH